MNMTISSVLSIAYFSVAAIYTTSSTALFVLCPQEKTHSGRLTSEDANETAVIGGPESAVRHKAASRFVRAIAMCAKCTCFCMQLSRII